MGFFSTRKKVVTGTTVARVIEDANITDSAKIAVANANYSGGDPAQAVLDASAASIATRIKSLYSHADKRSAYGLPTGEVFYNNHGKSLVQSILAGIEGQAITLLYCRFGPGNGLHWGWQILTQSHGYNTQTNELANLSVAEGLPVYLKSVALEIPPDKPRAYDPTSREDFGSPPKAGVMPMVQPASLTDGDWLGVEPAQAVSGFTVPRVRVNYCGYKRVEDPGAPNGLGYTERSVEGSFTIPVPQMVDDQDYFAASYQVGSTIKFWSYRKGQGDYASLDSFVGVQGADSFAEFYPNLYVRLNKQDLSGNAGVAKDNKRMFKFLGLNYSEISQQIHANPNIGDVDSAFITCGVPALTSNAAEAQYLFAFFDEAFSADKAIAAASDTRASARILFALDPANPALRSEKIHLNRRNIVIEDRSGFRMTLAYAHIAKSLKGGQFKPGAVKGDCGARVVSQVYQGDAYDDGLGGMAYQYETIKSHIYSRQVSQHFYEEVVVMDMAMAYKVGTDQIAVAGDNEEEIILVPVDKTIADTLDFRSREQLLLRSLHFVFNSMVIQQVKWYQTGTFAAFIKVVGIVITVATLGSDGGFFASLGAALSQGAAATVSFLVTQLALFVGTGLVIKEVIKAVGMEAAFLFAVVAAAYGGYQWMTSGANSKTFMLTAKEYLTLATNLAQGVTKSITSELNGLFEEQKAFDQLKSEQENLLKSEWDKLTETPVLDPFVILGESPGRYFDRTIHIGNPGVQVLDDVQSFVERALTLPSFAESVNAA